MLAGLSVYGKAVVFSLVLVIEKPHGQQHIVVLHLAQLDIPLLHRKGGVAGHALPQQGNALVLHTLFHPRENLVIGIIVFLRHKSAQILHAEGFHLVVGKRLDGVHQSVVDFLGAVCRNALIRDVGSTLYQIFLRFCHLIVAVSPRANLFPMPLILVSAMQLVSQNGT